MNEFYKEDRIKNLKAEFFDTFQNHTQDLVKFITLLANGVSEEEALKIQTNIFERIILLNKVGSNIKHLANNVNSLELSKNNGLLQIHRESDKENVSSSKSVIKEDTLNKSDKDSTNVYNLSHSSNNLIDNNDGKITNQVSIPLNVDKEKKEDDLISKSGNFTNSEIKEENNLEKEKVKINDEVQSKKEIIIPQDTNFDMNKIKLNNNEDDNSNAVDSNKIVKTDVSKNHSTSDVLSTIGKINSAIDNKAKERFKFDIKEVNKDDKENVRAILVSESQFNKLNESRESQIAIITILPIVSNFNEAINNMMKEASNLYKNGKITEAQKMYEKIRQLNKNIKRDKILCNQ